MVKYFTEEYFKQVEERLVADAKWQQDTKGIKTTILLSAPDQGALFLIRVEDGATTISKVQPGETTEFSFEGPYDVWTKVAKGEVDLQSAVLKGQLKFRGSITKILLYKDRFVRIAEVIRSVPVEFIDRRDEHIVRRTVVARSGLQPQFHARVELLECGALDPRQYLQAVAHPPYANEVRIVLHEARGRHLDVGECHQLGLGPHIDPSDVPAHAPCAVRLGREAHGSHSPRTLWSRTCHP